MAHHAKVDAIYRQYAIDHGHAQVEDLKSDPVPPAMHRIEAGDPAPYTAAPEDRPKGENRPAEATDLEEGEAPQPPDNTVAVASDRSTPADHEGRMRHPTISGDGDHASYGAAGSTDSYSAYRADKNVSIVEHNGGDGGDVPDDPRNKSNPKTGRLDASWSTYDQAITAAREHAGEDFGSDSVKMYDYHPETGEGTGTLIGEQTPDRLRGWRIDGRDGHVNWWDWTGGKKRAGGAHGHEWFPEDPSTPGSRYIGWAPWQDNDGNILDWN